MKRRTGARNRSDGRLRRRGGRLQSRQFGHNRHAGGNRCDRVDAVQGCKTLRTAQLIQKAKDYFAAVFNRTDVTNIVITADLAPSAV
jgi:hypothetical protein